MYRQSSPSCWDAVSAPSTPRLSSLELRACLGLDEQVRSPRAAVTEEADVASDMIAAVSARLVDGVHERGRGHSQTQASR